MEKQKNETKLFTGKTANIILLDAIFSSLYALFYPSAGFSGNFSGYYCRIDNSSSLYQTREMP